MSMSEECEPSKGTIEICIKEVVGSQFSGERLWKFLSLNSRHHEDLFDTMLWLS